MNVHLFYHLFDCFWIFKNHGKIYITSTIFCLFYHYPSSEHFLSYKTETLYPLNSNTCFPPPSRPWKLPFYFLSLRNWLIQVLNRSQITQYLSFYSYLISLIVMSLRFIHVVPCVRNAFFIKAELHSIVCIYHAFFFIIIIHSSISALLGSFFFSTTVNNTAMNKSIQLSLQVPAFSYLAVYSQMELLII